MFRKMRVITLNFPIREPNESDTVSVINEILAIPSSEGGVTWHTSGSRAAEITVGYVSGEPVNKDIRCLGEFGYLNGKEAAREIVARGGGIRNCERR